jgi:hypothetical protein
MDVGGAATRASALALVGRRVVPSALVNPDDPLPRLLTLHGALANSFPEDHSRIAWTDASGLIDSYARLRLEVISLVEDWGGDVNRFAEQFPELSPATTISPAGPRSQQELTARGRTAAGLLRQLFGYVSGLFQAKVIEDQVTEEQLRIAREAARPPVGFG